MSSEARAIENISKIYFNGPGTLLITQSDEESLTISAAQYLMKNIVSQATKDRLELGYKNSEIIDLQAHRESIFYDLRMKNVKQVQLSGRGRIQIPDLDNDRVKVSVLGSGEIILGQLTADYFSASIQGSGTIVAAGDVEMQSLMMTGSGLFSAEKLVSDFAEIRMSGASKVNISVSDQITATISDSGMLSYAGYPDVNKCVSGSGQIVRRRSEKHQAKKEENHV